ncbi:hypothetical protein AC788_05050 [Pseudomonas sp. RIT-PI-a]|nr:hypothetical protein AC788_05050 [Pseudomonas sp. RIT-PI-a]
MSDFTGPRLSVFQAWAPGLLVLVMKNRFLLGMGLIDTGLILLRAAARRSTSVARKTPMQ